MGWNEAGSDKDQRANIEKVKVKVKGEKMEDSFKFKYGGRSGL